MREARIACLVTTLAALPAAAGDEGRRDVIEQKAGLVLRVIEDPAVAQRIAAGASEEARTLQRLATQAHARALALAADGRYAESEAAVDEAMAAIGRARRLARDAEHLAAERHARYAAQSESSRALLEAAQRHAGARAAADAAAAMERSNELMAGAERLARAQRYEEASRALDAAEKSLLEAFGAMLGRTLDYTPRFATPAEELRHQTERFASFHRLVPIALRDLRPAPPAAEQVERHVGRAIELRDRAVASAQRGDTGAALAALSEGTEWLQRALAVAGLAVPGDVATKPKEDPR
jgi:hypothetical protein